MSAWQVRSIADKVTISAVNCSVMYVHFQQYSNIHPTDIG